ENRHRRAPLRHPTADFRRVSARHAGCQCWKCVTEWADTRKKNGIVGLWKWRFSVFRLVRPLRAMRTYTNKNIYITLLRVGETVFLRQKRLPPRYLRWTSLDSLRQYRPVSTRYQ